MSSCYEGYEGEGATRIFHVSDSHSIFSNRNSSPIHSMTCSHPWCVFCFTFLCHITDILRFHVSFAISIQQQKTPSQLEWTHIFLGLKLKHAVFPTLVYDIPWFLDSPLWESPNAAVAITKIGWISGPKDLGFCLKIAGFQSLGGSSQDFHAKWDPENHLKIIWTIYLHGWKSKNRGNTPKMDGEYNGKTY